MVDRRPMNREKTSAESRSTSRFSSRHETNTLTHSKNYRRTAGLRWLPIYGITSAYQIILWMANIHRYLQSAMQKWALFFSTIRPSVLNSCSTFISTFFSGWNGLWELVHIHGDTGKKRSRNYLNGHWHDDSEPNYPLIAIDVQSIPMFKCVAIHVYTTHSHTRYPINMQRSIEFHWCIQIIIKQCNFPIEISWMDHFIRDRCYGHSWRD